MTRAGKTVSDEEAMFAPMPMIPGVSSIRRGPAAPGLHLPFVDALTTANEGSPAWIAIKAGWLVVRFVDKWAEASVHAGGAPWLREVHAIHEAIGAVAPGPTRRVLERLYAALLESWGRRDLTVSSTLLAYGHHLERDEQWGMAADVFETFLLHARTDSDHELAPDAYLRLAYTHRRAGRIDDAAAAYDAAGALAISEGNVRAGLLARIGSARVTKHRGNLPAAAAALDAVIEDAAALVAIAPSVALSDALARAKHDRGTVANEMEQHTQAARLYYEALLGYQDEVSRERVLSDIANNFTSLGLRDAARDAYAVLHATAQEPTVRYGAAVNLMGIAVEDGLELVFKQYYRALADADLSPEIAAYYQLFAGEGLHRFGNDEQAREMVELSIETAERYQLNALAFRAEAVLGQLDRKAPYTPPASVETPAAITDVVSAVRRLRETTELAGAR
jgi:tetratricopeptide (TPR) repeat protein